MTSSPRLDLPCRVASSPASTANALGGTARPRRVALGQPARLLFPQSHAVKALACELAAQHSVLLVRWSLSELRWAVAQGRALGSAAPRCGAGSVRTPLVPGGIRSWIRPRDPAFAAKAERFLDSQRPALGRGPAPAAGGTSSRPMRKSASRHGSGFYPSTLPTVERALYVDHEYQRGVGLPPGGARAPRESVRPL